MSVVRSSRARRHLSENLNLNLQVKQWTTNGQRGMSNKTPREQKTTDGVVQGTGIGMVGCYKGAPARDSKNGTTRGEDYGV